MSKKKSKLQQAQDEAQAAINETNKKIEEREAVAHLTAMDMTMKCPHSSIKNLPLCLMTRLKEQRKKGLNWKEKNCVSVKSGKQG